MTSVGTAFENFKLRNGWKITSVVPECYTRGMGGWQFTKIPQEGTNDPHMKVKLSTTALQHGASVDICIYIQGPAGTSPYTGPVIN